MIERDNLHFSFNELDGYNKLFNLVICAREAGKTSALEYVKIYKAIKKGYGVVILMRYSKEINKLNLLNLQERINLYLPDTEKIEVVAEVGGYTNGIIKFTIRQGKTFLNGTGLLLWIGLDDQIIKNIHIKNPRFIVFDEYVVNQQSGERYIRNEFDKILILYGTIKRYKEDGANIRIYCAGNPYSKLNPFIEYFKINKQKLKEGATIVGPNFVLMCYKLKNELKTKLLNADPNYQFDDSFKAFALEGQYIYENLRINLIDYVPQFFKLDYVIMVVDQTFKRRYLGVYYNANYLAHNLDYCIKEITQKFNTSIHSVYAFNFENMDTNTILINQTNREILEPLRLSLSNGTVGFVNSFYYVNDFFKKYDKTF